MFTGIIQTIGKVTGIEATEKDSSIFFDCAELASQSIAIGDSIAVNGCCLTVVEKKNSIVKVDVSAETLDRTAMQHYQVGTLLNLELAMLPQTRFGGHIVSGHVDCLAQTVVIENQGRSTKFEFKLEGYGGYIAQKGSVTIDGVSLTVNDVRDEQGATIFSVNIIPHTLEATIIDGYVLGTIVHIEIDMIARYIERLNQYALNQSNLNKVM